MNAYKIDFKLLLEGVVVPFYGATITTTAEGVQARVNIPATSTIENIKRKTTVHIFYKDWVTTPKNPKSKWRILFDGCYSGNYETVEATQGRMISIICRDFRMDLRRAPAAIAFAQPLAGLNEAQAIVHKIGLYGTVMKKTYNPDLDNFEGNLSGKIIRQSNKLTTKQEVIYYDAITGADIGEDSGNAGLMNALSMVNRIAGSSRGENVEKSLTTGDVGSNGSKYQVVDEDKFPTFLDAVVRGILYEAVSGATIVAFMNKRLRADKKILTPVYSSGYNFWKKTRYFKIDFFNYFSGNAMFTSVEAAIMRLASVFMVRLFSCATPTPISVSLNSKASDYAMDRRARNFLVDTLKGEFGNPVILNEMMLLPPLDFTAPPNFNIIFSSMYTTSNKTFDFDSDYTRGYFDITQILNSSESSELRRRTIEFPNTLFKSNADPLNLNALKEDVDKRKIPPITIEERFSGVNVLYDNIFDRLARDDATSNNDPDDKLDKVAQAINDKIKELSSKQRVNKQELIDLNREISDAMSMPVKDLEQKYISALHRHATIKYVNSKYVGRTIQINGDFNPYIVCGFPSIIMAKPNDVSGTAPITNIIGTVQEITHVVYVMPNQGECYTTIVLNNVRPVNEPTFYDGDGQPMYMKKTFMDSDSYRTTDSGETEFKKDDESTTVDYVKNNRFSSYHVYARDLLTISDREYNNGVKNDVYLDDLYTPKWIHKFYDAVFGTSDHFMVKKSEKRSDGSFLEYTYDTIHEAAEKLKNIDYESSINYVYREIADIDSVFFDVLGCTKKDGVQKRDGVQKSYNNYDSDGKILLDSILSSMPKTVFIKERRDAVNEYLAKVMTSINYTEMEP